MAKSSRAQSAAFMCRMSPEMRDRLTAEAKSNNRSMNAELIWRLANSFGDESLIEVEAPGSASLLQQIADDLRVIRTSMAGDRK